MNGERGAADVRREAKALSVLSFSVIAGVLVFGAVSLVIHRLNGPFLQNGELAKTLFGVCLLLYVFSLSAARFIYNKRVNDLRASTASPSDKLNRYKKAFILFTALAEGPALVGIICFLLTGSFFILLVPVLAIVQMLLKRPTADRLEDALGTDTYSLNKPS